MCTDQHRTAGEHRSTLQGPTGVGFFFAALGLLYGGGNAVAALTAKEVVTTVSSVATATLTGLPAGVHLVAPHTVAVDASAAATGGMIMLKLGAAMVPILWGVVALAIAFLLRATSHVDGTFGSPVMKAVAGIRWSLVALVVAYGLRVLGANWVIGSLDAGLRPWTPIGEMFLPVLALYLVFAFELVLRRGGQLQGELDEVI
ncbi:hypothetical protein GCM10027030_22080 [Luteococcus sediminum]